MEYLGPRGMRVEKAPSDELHSLYHSPNIVRGIKFRRLRWESHIARMEEGRNAFKILTGKCTGKRHLEIPRRRCDDSIRMVLREMVVNTRNSIDSAQDGDFWRALVNAALLLLLLLLLLLIPICITFHQWLWCS